MSLVTRVVPARSGPAPEPVLLLLHGRGADEGDLLALSAVVDPRWRCVSARAPFAFPSGQGFYWYEMDGVGTPEAGSFATSLRLLAAMVDTLAVGGAPVVACGFSQGAVVALALLAQRPDRLTGAAALSGYLAVDAATLKGKPCFVAHGTLDPVIPVAYARLARDRLAAAGAQLTYREYPLVHQISEDELEDLDVWLGERLPPADGEEREGGRD